MCNCKEEEKTGTTTVMCCNICGMPDDPAWSVNQWIRIEDRLPEQSQNVIGWDSINREMSTGYFHGPRSGFIFHSHTINPIPTHWMPLPKVPPSILNNVYISEVKR